MEYDYVIIGLGNPGDAYKHTPHNAGRMAVEQFVEKNGCASFRPERVHKARVADCSIEKGERSLSIVLAMPETFMNASGKSVASFIRNEEDIGKLIIVYDDVDLPLGTLKVSHDRGTGGHNGVASIIKEVGTKKFIRVRVGIAPQTIFGGVRRPSGDKLGEYVLKPLSTGREKKLYEGINIAVEAIKVIIQDGVTSAMNIYN